MEAQQVGNGGEQVAGAQVGPDVAEVAMLDLAAGAVQS